MKKIHTLPTSNLVRLRRQPAVAASDPQLNVAAPTLTTTTAQPQPNPTSNRYSDPSARELSRQTRNDTATQEGQTSARSTPADLQNSSFESFTARREALRRHQEAEYHQNVASAGVDARINCRIGNLQLAGAEFPTPNTRSSARQPAYFYSPGPALTPSPPSSPASDELEALVLAALDEPSALPTLPTVQQPLQFISASPASSTSSTSSSTSSSASSSPLSPASPSPLSQTSSQTLSQISQVSTQVSEAGPQLSQDRQAVQIRQLPVQPSLIDHRPNNERLGSLDIRWRQGFFSVPSSSTPSTSSLFSTSRPSSPMSGVSSPPRTVDIDPLEAIEQDEDFMAERSREQARQEAEQTIRIHALQEQFIQEQHIKQQQAVITQIKLAEINHAWLVMMAARAAREQAQREEDMRTKSQREEEARREEARRLQEAQQARERAEEMQREETRKQLESQHQEEARQLEETRREEALRQREESLRQREEALRQAEKTREQEEASRQADQIRKQETQQTAQELERALQVEIASRASAKNNKALKEICVLNSPKPFEQPRQSAPSVASRTTQSTAEKLRKENRGKVEKKKSKKSNSITPKAVNKTTESLIQAESSTPLMTVPPTEGYAHLGLRSLVFSEEQSQSDMHTTNSMTIPLRISEYPNRIQQEIQAAIRRPRRLGFCSGICWLFRRTLRFASRRIRKGFRAASAYFRRQL